MLERGTEILDLIQCYLIYLWLNQIGVEQHCSDPAKSYKLNCLQALISSCILRLIEPATVKFHALSSLLSDISMTGTGVEGKVVFHIQIWEYRSAHLNSFLCLEASVAETCGSILKSQIKHVSFLYMLFFNLLIISIDKNG